MYQLFYDVLCVQSPACKMLKTDTNSMLIEVKINDTNEEIKTANTPKTLQIQ